MRRLNLLLLALAFTSPIAVSAPLQIVSDDETIRKGVGALTTHAIEGPTLQCDEDSMRLSKAYYGKGADCSAFIDSDGKFGKLGKTIVSHIESLGERSQYYRNDHLGMQLACPNWPNLSKDQKAHYWVWVFAAISWKESTCGAALTNKAATHGTAAGHLQLNLKRNDRAWRGGTSGESCGVPDIRQDEANLKCGVEIFNEQLKGKDGIYEGNGTLYGKGANAYWQHLRMKNGGLIMKLVKDFPHCKK